MNRTPRGRALTDDEIASVADSFESDDFSPTDVENIKQTRRRSPRLGETRAEVLTFRAPVAYKDRIKERAGVDGTSESQVIRDALDAYLGRPSA